MIFRGTAPAKIILCGEHAVVYGSPAIAVPIPQLRAYVEAKKVTTGLKLSSANTQEHLTEQDSNHPYIRLITQIAHATIGHIPPLDIHIRSEIPPASGFGSGAAVATAIARAVFQYTGVKPSVQDLNAYIYETEKHFHGTPSGIDNTVIVHEKPIFFVKSTQIEDFTISAPLHIVIANSGSKAATHETVSAVREQYQQQPDVTQAIFDRISAIGQEAKAAMINHSPFVLGRLLSENHRLLQALGVSSPELDTLVQAAMGAGALGAKLSGAGRGGNMLALVGTAPDQQTHVQHALHEAGAKMVYKAQLR